MKQHRVYFFSLLMAAVVLSAGWVQLNKVKSPLSAESKLWMEGTSSLHDWKCDATEITGSVEYEASEKVDISGAEVTIPVMKLECGHGAMNKRLQREMDAENFPTVEYKLNSAQLASGDAANFTMQTAGRLKVHGVEKPVNMTVTGQRRADGSIVVKGSTPLLMSDFGVKAPGFLGMSTGDQVTISFEVVTNAPQ